MEISRSIVVQSGSRRRYICGWSVVTNTGMELCGWVSPSYPPPPLGLSSLLPWPPLAIRALQPHHARGRAPLLGDPSRNAGLRGAKWCEVPATEGGGCDTSPVGHDRCLRADQSCAPIGDSCMCVNKGHPCCTPQVYRLSADPITATQIDSSKEFPVVLKEP
ncbi:hypothetical protein J4Q44_G00133740 [Coregonus suidteri]|uniref:Uncharacterized protein n=1 Tax=Coregonus suidteri TaxID=861788 RepID=A0AAN8M031_9TELE